MVAKTGKYLWIDMEYEQDDVKDKDKLNGASDEQDDAPPEESKLSKPVKELVEFMFDDK